MYLLSTNTLTHACICFGGWSGAIAPCGLGSKCWIPFPRRIPEEEGRASCINGILVDPLSLLSTNSRSIWKACHRRPFPRISDIKQESGREIVCWNRLLKLSSSSASSDIERGFSNWRNLHLLIPSSSHSVHPQPSSFRLCSANANYSLAIVLEFSRHSQPSLVSIICLILSFILKRPPVKLMRRDTFQVGHN